jgi:hypothetical protein
MDASEACRIINDELVFQPDWEISGVDHTNRFEDSCIVHFEFFAYDSKREHFISNTVHLYPSRIHVEFPIQVTECETAFDVMYKVHELIMRIYEHETREFLRLKSHRMEAPFHPHKPNTMMAYHERTGNGAMGLVDDLTYGIA